MRKLFGPLTRCGRRLRKAERLLAWVQDEADLSGQMELSAAIRAFLEEI